MTGSASGATFERARAAEWSTSPTMRSLIIQAMGGNARRDIPRKAPGAEQLNRLLMQRSITGVMGGPVIGVTSKLAAIVSS